MIPTLPNAPEADERAKKRAAYRKWYLANRERRREYMRRWKAINPQRVKAHCAAHWAKSKDSEKRAAKRKAWEIRSRQRLRTYQAQWRENNRTHVRKTALGNYHKNMRDPAKRILKNIRNRLRMAVGNVCHVRAKDGKAVLFLLWLAERNGIKRQDLGRFEIDHIVPLCRINLMRERSSAKANSPENVRWFSRAENLIKGYGMPSLNEIRAHRKIVKEWRTQNA